MHDEKLEEFEQLLADVWDEAYELFVDSFVEKVATPLFLEFIEQTYGDRIKARLRQELPESKSAVDVTELFRAGLSEAFNDNMGDSPKETLDLIKRIQAGVRQAPHDVREQVQKIVSKGIEQLSVDEQPDTRR